LKFFALLLPLAAFAQRSQVTFARDVAPIVYKNCASCHFDGGPAPFSLTSYADVKRHARQIAEVTASGYMPPWLPEHGLGDFQGELRLTDDQIRLIRTWVDSGSPEGNSADEPAPPPANNGWLLGPPDLIVKTPAGFHIPAEGNDVFWNFVLKPQLDRTRFIRAIDIRPSDPKVVHHANLIIDRLGSEESRESVPGAGFPGMDVDVLGSPLDLDGHALFWKPGSIPYAEPAGMSWRLDPGNDLILNLHLQPSGKQQVEQTVVGLYFTDERPTRFPYLLQLEDDQALDIPAGDRAFVVTDSFKLPIDTELVAIYPHAHYLGKVLEAWVTRPGSRRQWLIRIPDWDQNWQAVYRYREPLHLPAGAVVTMRYCYDNSAGNPRNPNTPPKRVQGGNRATDEMGHLWLELLPEHGGDARRVYAEAWARHQLAKHGGGDYNADVTLGALALSRLHSQEALTPLREAVALRPSEAIARNLFGVALDATGQMTQAREQFEAAVRLKPDFANARFNLAHALARSGDRDAAVRQLQAILKTNPADLAALRYLEDLKRSAAVVSRQSQ
jgi:hypothetical protein